MLTSEIFTTVLVVISFSAFIFKLIVVVNVNHAGVDSSLQRYYPIGLHERVKILITPARVY